MQEEIDVNNENVQIFSFRILNQFNRKGFVEEFKLVVIIKNYSIIDSKFLKVSKNFLKRKI